MIDTIKIIDNKKSKSRARKRLWSCFCVTIGLFIFNIYNYYFFNLYEWYWPYYIATWIFFSWFVIIPLIIVSYNTNLKYFKFNDEEIVSRFSKNCLKINWAEFQEITIVQQKEKNRPDGKISYLLRFFDGSNELVFNIGGFKTENQSEIIRNLKKFANKLNKMVSESEVIIEKIQKTSSIDEDNISIFPTPDYDFQITEKKIDIRISKNVHFNILWSDFNEIEIARIRITEGKEYFLIPFIIFRKGDNHKELLIDSFKKRIQNEIIKNLQEIASKLHKKFVISNIVYDPIYDKPKNTDLSNDFDEGIEVEQYTSFEWKQTNKSLVKTILSQKEIDHYDRDQNLKEKTERNGHIFLAINVIMILLFALAINLNSNSIIVIVYIFIIFTIVELVLILLLKTDINYYKEKIIKSSSKEAWIDYKLELKHKNLEIKRKKLENIEEKKILKEKLQDSWNAETETIIIKDTFITGWLIIAIIILTPIPILLFVTLNYSVIILILLLQLIIEPYLILNLSTNYSSKKKRYFKISNDELICFIPNLDYFLIKWKEIVRINMQEIIYPGLKFKFSSFHLIQESMKNPIHIYDFEIIYKNANLNFYIDKIKFHEKKINMIVQNLEGLANRTNRTFIIEENINRENYSEFSKKEDEGIKRYNKYKNKI